MTTAYLNGEFTTLEQAKISPLDRGFLFGDGVYEVIPFYHKQGVGLNEHLQRLSNSLKGIGLKAPLSDAEWNAIFEKLLEGDEPYTAIYLQVTRGADTQRQFSFPDDTVSPTVFAFPKAFTPGKNNNGIRTITQPDLRWQQCHIKSINLLPSCMATNNAVSQQVDDAIMIAGDAISEGASSNVFMVKDNHVYTTPASENILNGITRQLMIKLLTKQNIPVTEAKFTLDELYNADEVWLTSSTREIAPVIEVDEKMIGHGKPGAIWQQAYAAYQSLWNNDNDK